MNPTPSPERPEPTLQDMEDARNGENTCDHQSPEYCRSRFSCTRTAGHSGPHIGLGATPTPYWYEDGDIFPELYRVATRTPAPEAVAGERKIKDGPVYSEDGGAGGPDEYPDLPISTPPADKDAEIAKLQAELKQMTAERDSNKISVQIVQANRDEWERSWGVVSRERDALKLKVGKLTESLTTRLETIHKFQERIAALEAELTPDFLNKNTPVFIKNPAADLATARATIAERDQRIARLKQDLKQSQEISTKYEDRYFSTNATLLAANQRIEALEGALDRAASVLIMLQLSDPLDWPQLRQEIDDASTVANAQLNKPALAHAAEGKEQA